LFAYIVAISLLLRTPWSWNTKIYAKHQQKDNLHIARYIIIFPEGSEHSLLIPGHSVAFGLQNFHHHTLLQHNKLHTVTVKLQID